MKIADFVHSIKDSFENFPTNISVHDTDYRIVWENRASRRERNLSMQEMQGKLCFALKGYDSPCPNCPVTQVFETGRAFKNNVLMDKDLDPTEKRNYWNVKASPIHDSANNLLGAISIAEDVTEQIVTSHLLMKEENFISDIVTISEDIIWASNLESVITYIDGGLKLNLDYEKTEVIGKSLLEFIHPDDFGEMKKAKAHILENGEACRNRPVRLKHKDGQWVSFEINIVPIFDLKGNIEGFRGLNRNVSEQHKLTAQLIQAQKMEAIGRLAGGIAHDYNNMLGVILGYSELIMERESLTPETSSALQEIHRAATRSADLTRQLLTFARKQEIKPEPSQINEIISNALNMLRHLIGENISLKWKPCSDLWIAQVDATQIEQILTNLCLNAKHAIEGIGSITISTRNTSVSRKSPAGKPGLEPGDYVQIRVNDSGHGIDEKIIENIFEPFFTTKPLGEGTGLGLATVFGIVKQNHGYIYASSRPGTGAAFHIYLPRFTAKSPAEKETFPTREMGGGSGRVILVEDEPSFLEITGQMLKKLGYEVIPYDNPISLFKNSPELPEDVHLLITDVILPGMNGVELYHRLKPLNKDLQCIFISGYPASAISSQITSEDEFHYLNKPFSIETLDAAIREVLEPGISESGESNPGKDK